MKLWVSDYSLTPKRALNSRTALAPRHGALVKAETQFGIGYGDLHPWPEFGDAPIGEQLKTIAQGGTTPLFLRTISLLAKDARARAEGRSLTGPQPLQNNAAWDFQADESADVQIKNLQAVGFHTLKIKCGRDPVQESQLIQRLAQASSLKIRLDFNASMSFSEFQRFQDSVPNSVDGQIEYVEDPCSYEPSAWDQIRKRWKVALDFQINATGWARDISPSADVLILKPARTDVDEAVDKCTRWGLGLTVTSMMDHPVGVAHASAVALELQQRGFKISEDAGCLTTSLYEENDFAKLIKIQGPFLSFAKGHGVGFDELLEAQPWRSLITA